MTNCSELTDCEYRCGPRQPNALNVSIELTDPTADVNINEVRKIINAPSV